MNASSFRLGNSSVPWLLVLLVAMAGRLAMWHGYDPVVYPDTGTYFQAAHDLLTGDFSVGQGRRTPGYPLVIAAFGFDPRAIVAFQLMGGIATSLLLYWIGTALSGSRTWGAAAGLAHALNLQQLFVEGALLTEATSALSVAAALALLVATCARIRRGESATWHLLALGLLSAYALFVRPQFLCLLLIVPPAVAYAALRRTPSLATAAISGILALLPALALVFAWGMVEKAETGYFTLSTQSGFGVVNHTIDYIELAPDEYATVREILLRVRERRMADVGHSGNTIWYAWPEIRRATGWSLPEASRHLQEMSRKMVIAHPWLYARSVASAWMDFWTVPFFWVPEQVSPPALRRAVEAIWWIEHKILRLGNLAFVLIVVAVVVWPALRRRLGWDAPFSALSATVLMSSLIQALADQGASSRYHLPTQSMVILVLLVAVARAWRRSESEAAAPPDVPDRSVTTRSA